MFQNTDTTYLKKGFSKFAKIKEEYASECALALTRGVFSFFQGLEQGNSSLVVFEKKLRYASERLALI